MSASTAPSPAARPRSRGQRFLDAAVTRLAKLPRAANDYTVTRDIPVQARDGVVLLADHLAPVGQAAGTILIRGPYGFPALSTAQFGGPFAARGYHVVLARCRGTFGSGGEFEPMQREVEDAADTVEWLRKQPWFAGRFATWGASYLGFTEWALLMDPPQELAAAVIAVGPHDFSRSAYYGGAFSLNDFFGWSNLIAYQERLPFLRAQLRMATSDRRLAPALAELPLTAAADKLREDGAPWYRDWVSRRDLADPFWSRMQLEPALDRVGVPVLLQTGWQDLFLQQTMTQYEHLHSRGLDVALTVGPWTHTGLATAGTSTIFPEALDWMAEHLAGTRSRTRPAAVRVFVTGARHWRDMPAWAPPAAQHPLYPQPGGGLGDQPAEAGTASATFTYDPADPTPAVGGRLLSPMTGGYKEDSALARRLDVLAFTSPPLTTDLEAIGVPVLELDHASDNPHCDLFARVSEVNAKGKSHNVSDGFIRLDPGRATGRIRLELDPIAHRFTAGSQIRLLIAGGCFPRWERNLGTSQDPATSTAMAPSHRSIDLAESRLLLPVKA